MVVVRHVANVNVVGSNLIARLKAISGHQSPDGLFRALSSHPHARYAHLANPAHFPFYAPSWTDAPYTGLPSDTELVTIT